MNIAVIGTGYVGLVTGTCFAEMGNHVICVDNDKKKLENIKKGIIPIYEPGLEILLNRNIEKQRLTFIDDLSSAVTESEIIFLCLPTPQSEDGSADLNHVFDVAGKIGKILKKSETNEFKIIVNKSTVPVGTSSNVTKLIAKYCIGNFEVPT